MIMLIFREGLEMWCLIVVMFGWGCTTS